MLSRCTNVDRCQNVPAYSDHDFNFLGFARNKRRKTKSKAFLNCIKLFRLITCWLNIRKPIQCWPKDIATGIHSLDTILIMSRIRRKVLISFPGLSLLFLGAINWIWTVYGMNIVYSNYPTYKSCSEFVNNIILGNLLISGILALPVIWIFFWMVIIKGLSLTLGLLSPPMLIWLKKKTHGL